MRIVSYALMVQTQTEWVDWVQHCTRAQFRCGDGSCILEGLVLDGKQNCPNGEDENICELPCQKHDTIECDITYFETMKIRANIGCVGQLNCLNHPKASVEFTENANDRAKLEFFKDINNDTADMHFWDKDVDSYFSMSTGEHINNTRISPEKGSIPCLMCHPKCFPLHALCVYDQDMFGQLRHCLSGSHLADCRFVGCPGKFKCPGSYCIPIRKVCDDVWDCPGQEDENPDMCRNHRHFYTGCFRCNNGICLDQSEVCDGYPDCGLTAEDEVMCNVSDCPHGCRCLWQNMICSGEPAESTIRGYSHVFITGTLFTTPTFKNGSDFTQLTLTHNVLTLIGPNAFWPLTLLHLEISHQLHLKPVSYYAFASLTSLVTLSITNCPYIIAWSQQAFSNLSSLVTLNLSRTAITHVFNDTFADMHALQNIDLSHSTLLEIDVTQFKSGCRIDTIWHQEA